MNYVVKTTEFIGRTGAVRICCIRACGGKTSYRLCAVCGVYDTESGFSRSRVRLVHTFFPHLGAACPPLRVYVRFCTHSADGGAAPPAPPALAGTKNVPVFREREYSASAVLTDILFLMYNYQRGIRGALSGSKTPPFVRIFGDVPHAECPVLRESAVFDAAPQV